MVELMNGTIDCQSEVGKGTTFTIRLDIPVADRQLEEMRFEGIEALIADDDPILLDTAADTLESLGIPTERANSGEEALEMIRRRHEAGKDYDVVILDWKMPGMDGVETTRQIRSIVGNNTPIIILTSYNWEDIEGEAREAGVDTFASKPLFAGTVMDEFRTAFRKKNAEPDRPAVDLKGRRILLAEDVEINAEIMMMVLSMREMDVDHAENGKIAVEMYQGHEPGYYDAVLMDMRMPEMDGLEATQTIRASGRADAETIPIIALTANAFDEDVQRSMQAGLNAHLSKPVEPDLLFETLEELL
jgi:CheY-like chemotaxis protein